MKNLKRILLSMIVAIFALTSCTNEEPIVNQEKEAVESVSARTAMNELQYHFDENGALRSSNNQTGNILFDYCFDFEYPVTFSYNTDTTVTVNDFDALVAVLINMTDSLYVDGIVFPFNVTVFDDTTGTIVVQTITNESDFEVLITSCSFDEEDCACTDDFEPVCIEVAVDNGDSFVMQFPNMCVAECVGFTQNNVVDCGNVIDPGVGADNCFEFEYPFSLVYIDGTTIVINSDGDWESAMYTMVGGFDFVYPFNVILTANGNVETIHDANEFGDLLETCYDVASPCDCSTDYDSICVESDGFVIEYTNFCLAQCDGFTQDDVVDCDPSGGDCNITNLAVTVGDCNGNGTYNLTINFDHENANNEYFDLYVRNNQFMGYYLLSDLPITITNFYPSDMTEDYIKVAINDNNDCYSEFEWISPDCGDINMPCWEFVYPVQVLVNGEEQTVNNDTELTEIISNPSVQFQEVYPFDVTIEGEVLTISMYTIFWEIGGWSAMCE